MSEAKIYAGYFWQMHLYARKTKDSFIVLPVYMKFISWAKTLGVIDFISIEVWVSSAKPPVNMAWKYALPADKTARWAWNL